MTEHLVPVQEVLIAVVPEGIDPEAENLGPSLTATALEQCWGQYGAAPPSAFRNFDIEWLITNELEAIERFQPAHNCAKCLAGSDQAAAFLREHPGRYLALANMTYLEVWEDQ